MENIVECKYLEMKVLCILLKKKKQKQSHDIRIEKLVGRRRLPCSDVVSLVIGSRRKIVIHWTTNFPFLTTTCTKNPNNSLLKDSHSCP